MSSSAMLVFLAVLAFPVTVLTQDSITQSLSSSGDSFQVGCGCDENEEFNECGTACPKTCANYGTQIICTALCKSGCFCKEGFVRNQKGKCVRPEQCVPAKCGKNEEYNECGTLCPRTCGNYRYQIRCVAGCNAGCFCKDGFIRNEKTNECVKPEQCVPAKCGRNEEYNECGTLCPRTCENYGYQIKCVAGCKAGCFCKDGFIRNEETKQCIKPEQCVPGGCKKNEIYSTCANPCNDCFTKGNCQFLVCNKGCDCVPGYYRNRDNICIPEWLCNLTTNSGCGENEEFNKCGTACPQTCKNYGAQIKCTAQCKSGCFCKEGFVRNEETMKCVIPEQCVPGGCEENEMYSTCVVPCNGCSIKGKCNFLVCNKGCDCKPGYYRIEDGENNSCIPESQCQTISA